MGNNVLRRLQFLCQLRCILPIILVIFGITFASNFLIGGKHSTNAEVKGIKTSSVAITPTITRTPSAALTAKTSNYATLTANALQTTNTPLIDCTGPDGKHLQLSQTGCETFNNAWTNPSKTNNQVSSVQNTNSQTQTSNSDKISTNQESPTSNTNVVSIETTPTPVYEYNCSPNLSNCVSSVSDTKGLTPTIIPQDGSVTRSTPAPSTSACPTESPSGNHVCQYQNGCLICNP